MKRVSLIFCKTPQAFLTKTIGNYSPHSAMPDVDKKTPVGCANRSGQECDLINRFAPT